MIGSSAESQLHIHSINKRNDPNLAFADYLPIIVWPAKLYISHKPDTFCFAALIASDLCLTASTRRGSHLIKQSVHECDFADTDCHMVKEF